MAANLIFLVVGIASLVLGAIVLITASVATVDARVHVERCNKVEEPLDKIFKEGCDQAKLWISACAFGIIAGSIQILAMIAAWKKSATTWCVIHVVALLLTGAAFGIAIHVNVFAKVQGRDKTTEEITKQAFSVWCILDSIFCLVGIILTCLCTGE